MDAFADIPDETWARVIGVNLTGAFYCARQAVRAMQKVGTAGVVINIASTAAVSGDGPAHYELTPRSWTNFKGGFMAKYETAFKLNV